MVQIFREDAPLSAQLGQMLGQNMASGLAKNFVNPEVLVQRNLLSEAFANLDPNASYEDQLKALVPTLMTTQGGAEALQTIAPILQQRAKNRATSDAIRKERGLNEDRSIMSQQEPAGPMRQGQVGVQPTNISGEMPTQREADVDRFRNPKAYLGAESTYPQKTTGPQPVPLMSPAEMKNYALDLMDTSDRTGTPMSFQEAMGLAEKEQSTRDAYNQGLRQDQEAQRKHIEAMSADLVNRAINSGLIESADDEAKTLVEKLAYESRGMDTPADQWEYVRTGMRKFDNARQSIRREGSIPGPFEKFERKYVHGNFKDKETLMRDLQPALDIYREYGLIDEARNELTTQLGMGPEDTEMTIFPLSKEEKNAIKSFPKSPYADKSLPQADLGFVRGGMKFLKDEDFQTFKDGLDKYLKENPQSNLIVLRGYMTQDKKYNHADFSEAIRQLEEEGRFVPDNYQYSQLPIVNKPPLPGLTEQFKFLWKGTK